jgi:hypothetical protein
MRGGRGAKEWKVEGSWVIVEKLGMWGRWNLGDQARHGPCKGACSVGKVQVILGP